MTFIERRGISKCGVEGFGLFLNGRWLTHWTSWSLKSRTRWAIDAVTDFRNLDTLTSRTNLTETYAALRRQEKAEKLEIQAMDLRIAGLGLDHPHALSSMSNLACKWKSLHFDNEAIKLLRNCYFARRRILGPKHPQTVSTLDTLDKWS